MPKIDFQNQILFSLLSKCANIKWCLCLKTFQINMARHFSSKFKCQLSFRSIKQNIFTLNLTEFLYLSNLQGRQKLFQKISKIMKAISKA